MGKHQKRHKTKQDRSRKSDNSSDDECSRHSKRLKIGKSRPVGKSSCRDQKPVKLDTLESGNDVEAIPSASSALMIDFLLELNQHKKAELAKKLAVNRQAYQDLVAEQKRLEVERLDLTEKLANAGILHDVCTKLESVFGKGTRGASISLEFVQLALYAAVRATSEQGPAVLARMKRICAENKISSHHLELPDFSHLFASVSRAGVKMDGPEELLPENENLRQSPEESAVNIQADDSDQEELETGSEMMTDEAVETSDDEDLRTRIKELEEEIKRKSERMAMLLEKKREDKKLQRAPMDEDETIDSEIEMTQDTLDFASTNIPAISAEDSGIHTVSLTVDHTLYEDTGTDALARPGELSDSNASNIVEIIDGDFSESEGRLFIAETED